DLPPEACQEGDEPALRLEQITGILVHIAPRYGGLPGRDDVFGFQAERLIRRQKDSPHPTPRDRFRLRAGSRENDELGCTVFCGLPVGGRPEGEDRVPAKLLGGLQVRQLEESATAGRDILRGDPPVDAIILE